MKNKRGIFLLLLLIPLGIFFMILNSSKEIATYTSPDGDYELVIAQNINIFSSTMPGDGGTSSEVVAILKDAKGKIIGKSSDNENCTVMVFSIDVTWDIENMQVWYAKARTINLKTGKVVC